MTPTSRSLEFELERALAIHDPERRLTALEALAPLVDGMADRVRKGRAQAIRELSAVGRSWVDIAAIIGISPQRAQQIANNPNHR